MKKKTKISDTILALDLATCDTGWAIVDKNKKLINYGLIHSPASRPIERRLLDLYDELSYVIDGLGVPGIAIEDQFLRKGVKTLKALSWARGVAMLLAAQRSLPISVINNKSAKKATGWGNANKELVKDQICKEYNLPEDIDLNITDAIAIAWAYYSQREENKND